MSNVRSTRFNRGNNLSKLINQERELLEENGTSVSVQDNDDVINLLFNEDDEEDEDMKVSNEEINNNDDEFSASGSSSDDDSSDYDDSDNETNKKRKRKQNLLKSKAGFKRSKDIPILIKRKSTKSTNNKRSRASSESVEAIDLMSTENRRTSSRKSALENRLKVYNNLKEKEENRVKNFARHNAWRSKKIELKLTQEDRMKEALETEKINIASLQRFREVEIYQKLQREELHKRNKIKFTNFEKILRFSSEETLVTPEDDLKLYEIQTQNILNHLNRSAKRKYLKEEEEKQQQIKEILGISSNAEQETENNTDIKTDSIKENIIEQPLQGPSNKVSRNILSLYYFNSEEKMTSSDLKAHFNFNKLNSDTNSAGSSYMKRIVYCKKTDGEDNLVEPANQSLVTSKQLQSLMSTFMEFGSFDSFSKTKDVVDKDVTDKDEKKSLKYMLPPSLFYKNLHDNNTNNVKKNCYLKCNEKVKYIDPKLNIAYSDLEVYKNLNSMINYKGGFKWISFNGNNGMYINEQTEHAKGVPLGF